MPLSAAQENALARILEGESLFLTGGDGSGTAAVLDEAALRLGGAVRLNATGLGATIRGQESVRSFFGMNRHIAMPQAATMGDAMMRKLRGARIIMVEGCERLRIDQFQEMRDMLVAAACGYSPFGGRQIILSGDFTQLTAIVGRDEETRLSAIYGAGHRLAPHGRHWGAFGFASLGASPDHPPAIGAWLADWRQGVVGPIPAVEAEAPANAVMMTLSQAAADSINARMMERLPEGVFRIPALEEGEVAEMAPPAMNILAMRRGSRVLISADHPDGRYRCGEAGELLAFRRCANGEPLALVRRDDGSEVEVVRHAWASLRHVPTTTGELVAEQRGRILQTPLLPGWAISIWRMAGMRLAAAHAEPDLLSGGRAGFVVSRMAHDDGLTVSRMPDNTAIPGPAISDSELAGRAAAAREPEPALATP